jgi:hypothetical protein
MFRGSRDVKWKRAKNSSNGTRERGWEGSGERLLYAYNIGRKLPIVLNSTGTIVIGSRDKRKLCLGKLEG